MSTPPVVNLASDFDPEDFLSRVRDPPLHGSATVPLGDLLAWHGHVLHSEQSYRTVCAERDRAYAAAEAAEKRASVAYGHHKDIFRSYLLLVEKLAVEMGGFPPPPVAGPSQPRAPGKRKRKGVAPSVSSSSRSGPDPVGESQGPSEPSSFDGKGREVINVDDESGEDVRMA